jgi:hypothetical protein
MKQSRKIKNKIFEYCEEKNIKLDDETFYDSLSKLKLEILDQEHEFEKAVKEYFKSKIIDGVDTIEVADYVAPVIIPEMIDSFSKISENYPPPQPIIVSQEMYDKHFKDDIEKIEIEQPKKPGPGRKKNAK